MTFTFGDLGNFFYNALFIYEEGTRFHWRMGGTSRDGVCDLCGNVSWPMEGFTRG